MLGKCTEEVLRLERVHREESKMYVPLFIFFFYAPACPGATEGMGCHAMTRRRRYVRAVANEQSRRRRLWGERAASPPPCYHHRSACRWLARRPPTAAHAQVTGEVSGPTHGPDRRRTVRPASGLLVPPRGLECPWTRRTLPRRDAPRLPSG